MPQCHRVPVKWQAFFSRRRCGVSTKTTTETTRERVRRVSRFIIAGKDRQIDQEREREREREREGERQRERGGKNTSKIIERNWRNVYYSTSRDAKNKKKWKKNEKTCLSEQYCACVIMRVWCQRDERYSRD